MAILSRSSLKTDRVDFAEWQTFLGCIYRTCLIKPLEQGRVEEYRVKAFELSGDQYAKWYGQRYKTIWPFLNTTSFKIRGGKQRAIDPINEPRYDEQQYRKTVANKRA